MRPLETDWSQYRELEFPDPTSKEIAPARKAFYVGAMCMLTEILSFISYGDVDEVRRVRALRDELDEVLSEIAS